MLRELSEDMAAPVEWHYADVVEDYRGRLNMALASLRMFIDEEGVPDDFIFLTRDYSTSGKTVGQQSFDRLRRAVEAASELADAIEAPGGRPSPPRKWEPALHPEVQRVSGQLMADGHGSQAIFEAFKAVNIRVKELSGLPDDGKSLMAKAFSERDPVLRLNEGKSRSDADEQEGFKLILMGVMQGIRNPKAHDLIVNTDQERVTEYLALASLLMRRLDVVQRSRDPR
jgi:uncharacterized protein (TIGR02391 family)